MKLKGRVVLLTNMPYEGTTAESVLGGLGRAYRSAGLTVTAVGQRPVGARIAGRERRDWGTIHRIGGFSAAARQRSRRTYEELAPLLRGSSFVHMQLACLWTPLAALDRALASSAVPFGVTFQDYGNPTPRVPASERRRLRSLLARSAWVTAVSKATARKLEAKMPELAGRVRVVPNGFDAPYSGGSASIARPERPFVLCIGCQAYYKGIDLLLMAWKDVCERRHDVELVVCGIDYHGGHYRRLAQLLGLAERVTFTGPIPRENVQALLRRCLFTVMPSRHEAFGMAVIESMASGKPVLATRSGGPEEIIKDRVSGLLVEAGSVEALAGGLFRLLESPSLRRTLGAQARRRSVSYRWDAIARSYRSLGGLSP